MTDLSILYEDEALLLVDKQPGLHSAMLPTTGGESVAALLAARYPGCASASLKPEDAGLVNRLDRETSGILIAAKDRRAWEALRAALAAGEIWKSYCALVEGRLVERREISSYIGTPNRRAAKVKVYWSPPARSARALPANTVLEPGPYDTGLDASLILAVAESARRHQIRAHAAAVGHALLGDTLYGATRGTPPSLGRQFFLHCGEVRMISPASGASVNITAPLPTALLELFPAGAPS